MDVRPSSRGVCTRIDRWSLSPVVDGLLLPPTPFVAWWFLVGGFFPVGFRTQMRAGAAANCETLQLCFIRRSTFSNSSSVTPINPLEPPVQIHQSESPVKADNPNTASPSRQSKHRQSEPPVKVASPSRRLTLPPSPPS
jgi:hypothetical protein